MKNRLFYQIYEQKSRISSTTSEMELLIYFPDSHIYYLSQDALYSEYDLPLHFPNNTKNIQRMLQYGCEY